MNESGKFQPQQTPNDKVVITFGLKFFFFFFFFFLDLSFFLFFVFFFLFCFVFFLFCFVLFCFFKSLLGPLNNAFEVSFKLRFSKLNLLCLVHKCSGYNLQIQKK